MVSERERNWNPGSTVGDSESKEHTLYRHYRGLRVAKKGSNFPEETRRESKLLPINVCYFTSVNSRTKLLQTVYICQHIGGDVSSMCCKGSEGSKEARGNVN